MTLNSAFDLILLQLLSDKKNDEYILGDPDAGKRIQEIYAHHPADDRARLLLEYAEARGVKLKWPEEAREETATKTSKSVEVLIELLARRYHGEEVFNRTITGMIISCAIGTLEDAEAAKKLILYEERDVAGYLYRRNESASEPKNEDEW